MRELREPRDLVVARRCEESAPTLEKEGALVVG